MTSSSDPRLHNPETTFTTYQEFFGFLEEIERLYGNYDAWLNSLNAPVTNRELANMTEAGARAIADIPLVFIPYD